MERAAATVIATRRSAPRPVGSKLLVGDDGTMEGSVSGGCVESDVYEACRGVLRGDSPRVITYGITDEQALEVGLPCGGEIDVFVGAYAPAMYEQIGERRAVVYTDLESGEQRLVFEGEDDTTDAVIRSARSQVLGGAFAEFFGPPPRLLVFGAIDTGEALCRAAKELGWRTIVADALAQVKPDHATAVVVLTHDDKFDVPAIAGTLETDAFYVGAIGSRRNQERRRGVLLDAGVPEEALERLHGPAGLDLGAHTPSETALSILAEILAVRTGRAGGALRESTQRIHVEV